jgi:ribokinase
LESEGVATRHVIRDADAATGVALILVDQKGQKQILTAPGANRRLTALDVHAARGSFAATRAVLAPLEAPLDCIADAFRLGRAAGAICILDPAPATPLPDEFLRLVHVIRPNASEAQVLTGISVTDRQSARQAAGQLLRRGVQYVAIQAGDEGNFLLSEAEEVWLPKLPVNSVDATGAGDAFAAGLTVALAEGWPLKQAGQFASACAALATTKVGAQAGLPRRDEVRSLLSRSYPTG